MERFFFFFFFGHHIDPRTPHHRHTHTKKKINPFLTQVRKASPPTSLSSSLLHHQSFTGHHHHHHRRRRRHRWPCAHAIKGENCYEKGREREERGGGTISIREGRKEASIFFSLSLPFVSLLCVWGKVCVCVVHGCTYMCAQASTPPSR